MTLTEEQVQRINEVVWALEVVQRWADELPIPSYGPGELSNASRSLGNAQTYLHSYLHKERPDRLYEITGYKKIDLSRQRIQARTADEARERFKEKYMDPVVITETRRVEK